MAHIRVRYAENQGRFQPCKMTDSITLVEGKTTAFPQNTSSRHTLDLEQDEDSFFLDIWTPETEGIKPVLFWIHGGAFVMGASGKRTNSAALLARNANIIVVSVTYRLGILGLLASDELPQKNCGFHDIATALQWTRKHIAHWDGDPCRITVGGQSSGAWYAMALHTSPLFRDMIYKTMLFSFPGTFKPSTKEIAKEIAEKTFSLLHCTADSINEVPLKQILAVQKKIGKINHRKYKFEVPILPSIEDGFIVDDFYKELPEINKSIYVQYTHDECAFYTYKYPIGRYFPPFLLALFLRRYIKTNTLQIIREDRKLSKDSYTSLVNLTSEILFKEPAHRIGKVCKLAQIHEFSFITANPRIRCCHCIDLPFIFGNYEIRMNNAMLRGCDIEKVKKTSQIMQKKIAAFC